LSPYPSYLDKFNIRCEFRNWTLNNGCITGHVYNDKALLHEDAVRVIFSGVKEQLFDNGVYRVYRLASGDIFCVHVQTMKTEDSI
jgi:hypothetical protein